MDMETPASAEFLMLPVTDTSGNKNSNDKKFSSKSPPTDTFVDESDDDDVLNEKVSNERKIKSMEKAQRILICYNKIEIIL